MLSSIAIIILIKHHRPYNLGFSSLPHIDKPHAINPIRVNLVQTVSFSALAIAIKTVQKN